MDIGFAFLDYVVLLAYVGVLTLVVRWARKPTANGGGNGEENSSNDYFLGGRNIPWWAASFSFLATAISAATFLGVPNNAYNGNLSYISASIASILAIFIVSFYFIPIYYKYNVKTVYELLTHRFDQRASIAASLFFILGRCLASGARLFLASIPLAMIIANDSEGSELYQVIIICVMVFGSLILVRNGGIRSVIWTDVIQFFILIGSAVIAMILILSYIPAPLSDIWDILSKDLGDGSSKLTIIDTRPGKAFNIWPIIFGMTLLNIGAYGTDQDMAQRMLTCKDIKQSRRSIIGAALIAIPKDLLFAGLGLLLYIFYQHGAELGMSSNPQMPGNNAKVFSHFILHEMPAGFKGLAICGLCAAAVSGLTSEMNAMSSTFVNDCWSKWFPKTSEDKKVTLAKNMSLSFGIGLAACASLCIIWSRDFSDLLTFTLYVMVYAYSGLVAVFFCAIFTKRGNSTSIISALFTGFTCIIFLSWCPWPVFGTGDETQTLNQLIAFPWKMCIATSAAFLVAITGTQKQKTPD